MGGGELNASAIGLVHSVPCLPPFLNFDAQKLTTSSIRLLGLDLKCLIPTHIPHRGAGRYTVPCLNVCTVCSGTSHASTRQDSLIYKNTALRRYIGSGTIVRLVAIRPPPHGSSTSETSVCAHAQIASIQAQDIDGCYTGTARRNERLSLRLEFGLGD